ncbi:MAG: hypothetical protein Tsb004_28290 [Allomuricauda sp.]
MDDILFFDYNQKSSILLLFFFNAMVFTFLLVKTGMERRNKSNFWLAAFTFLGGLYISPFMCGYGGWYTIKAYREFLFFMPLQQLFLIGPVLYFYMRSLLDGNFEFRRKHLLHFIPAILYLMYSAVVFVTDVWILDAFYFYADGRDKDLDFWYQFAGLISMLCYLALGVQHYRNYRKAIVQEVSFAEDITFKWANRFMLAFGAILILRVLFFILNPEWGQFGSKYWYYLCFSVLCFYIGLSGYANSLKTVIPFTLDGVGEIETVQESTKESSESTIWKEKIDDLFEKKAIYKDPGLTLSDVASRLGTNRNIVSQTINREFELNFNDYVNRQRAQAVIRRLEGGQHAHTTLLGIALECGFNSKSTFNRAFKRLTGLTPNHYIKVHQLQ